ncbi:hypothetical protein Cni_G02421 [Canna indica]|uniref:Carbohydrate kinase PfkB domain-containing protein n=1 Tax=Canna indica TaxID=4628 RepID=A0AAQ3JQ33_9LILI|nr:hypothetical protein Cni_G02421 [Canna indica]
MAWMTSTSCSTALRVSRWPSSPCTSTRSKSSCSTATPLHVFHYGSISLITEPYRSAHLKALEVVNEARSLLSYDPNLRLPLGLSEEEARKQILSIWDQANIIKVSDVELEFLTGHDSSRR